MGLKFKRKRQPQGLGNMNFVPFYATHMYVEIDLNHLKVCNRHKKLGGKQNVINLFKLLEGDSTNNFCLIHSSTNLVQETIQNILYTIKTNKLTN